MISTYCEVSMKKIIIKILLVLVPHIAVAKCSSYVIGFRGQGGAFDHVAFENYARVRNLCAVAYNHTEIKQAKSFIDSMNKPYMLYGFSAGAASVAYIFKTVKKKPGYILTIGALYSTRLDFDKFDVDYDNFFDESGRGQRSPGIHVTGVPHMRMQQYVNDFFN
jgi:hypothetical protein